MSKNMTSTTGHDTYFNGKIISLPEVGNRDNALTFYETSRLITLGRRTEQIWINDLYNTIQLQQLKMECINRGPISLYRLLLRYIMHAEGTTLAGMQDASIEKVGHAK
jgi:hypothetical protein